MPRDYDPKTVELAVNTIKTLSIDAVEKANSGHPGAPMGLANVAFELWSRYMRYDPKDPQWFGRDRFVLSCGHASMLLYSMLHLSGYDLSMSELQSFRQWGSRTPGHPEAHLTPGVEATTGPLGQGVGNAIGMALAAKLQEARFGEPAKGIRIFTLASDGDMMEGVSGEASSLAGHLGLGNLIVIYDDNKITLDGEAKMSFSENVGKRYEAYGWFVQGPIDGHDHKQIRAAVDRALQEKDRPSFIVASTHIANGAPHLHDTSEAHGAPLGKDEVAATKKNLGWDPDKFFYVPAEVTALFKDRASDLAKEHEAWNAKFEGWKKANVELAKQFDAFQKKSVPSDLYEQLLKALPEKEDATRSLSAALEQTVAKLVPSLIGGSADLQTSNKTNIKGSPDIAKGKFEGRNFRFGVREHGMGAICNGMALFGGVIPFGSTFLVFSDYMRGAVRLSALSHLKCLWVYTHDSVMLGEDGPTHQPVEHYWALRLIPNMYFVRPADALETAAAWAIALGRDDGPTAFALTRQKLPAFKRDAAFDPKSALKGLYVAQEATGGKPDLVIVASGSEVQLAVSVRERLEKAGRKVRVVSALCIEAFKKQDAAYRESVMPRGVRKVSIELGRSEPWASLVGESGLAIGLDHFGASAPDKTLAKEFGFTADAVLTKIEAWL
jgi:transketolase